MIMADAVEVKAKKYPCEPTPFDTMMGVVMICKKCGHYAPPECK
jgi:hypothetical protein